jgi:hypothetical protein
MTDVFIYYFLIVLEFFGVDLFFCPLDRINYLERESATTISALQRIYTLDVHTMDLVNMKMS